MNKYQEAFERIKEECSKYNNFDIINDFITLKELVEKATSKKVEKQEHLYDVDDKYVGTRGKCPKCKKWILIEYGDEYKCCQYCGQALDWSEEE